jgi:hypothetical protein
LLKQSSSDSELQELLFFTNSDLKALYKETKLKSSGDKAELIGRLVDKWRNNVCLQDLPTSSNRATLSEALSEVQDWGKNLASLENFNLIRIFDYLVKSRNHKLDQQRLKAYISLKAYKYFDDNVVTNVWSSTLQGMIMLKAHCFSSLKAKSTYDVFISWTKDGNIVACKCSCVAGKGEACSHVAAVMFHLENHMRMKEKQDLPINTTATGRLQQWHVPSVRQVELSHQILSPLKVVRRGRLSITNSILLKH